MKSSKVRPGDLAVVDVSLDRFNLYLELRSVPDKRFYSDPRVVIDPDDTILVIAVEGDVSHILTSRGNQGWIGSSVLQVVSARPGYLPVDS